MILHGLNIVLLFLTGTCLAAVLRNFQVTNPPIAPKDAKECTIKVLQRDFAFSFGSAEVVQLTPPTDCGPPGSWAAITLNLTVTSNGTQFDRLGIFTFQNVEIWRTSTPEPTRGDGIIWTYIKDVSQYTPLFTKPGTFIFQLDNLIQPGLDGIYSTIVHATFYASSSAHPPAKKADVIIPLSTFLNDTGNDASVPPAFSLPVIFPRNAVQAYAEIFASGNAQEESWYFNVPNRFLGDIPSGLTFGQGPFREVRLLIDGRVAGVAFPYTVIFTGGFVPSFWRPISAYGALELPTYHIDITPFIPLLTDGKAHMFTIDVISAEDDHLILPNWYVSGLVQVTTDSTSVTTTGKMTVYDASPFAGSVTRGTFSHKGVLDFTVESTHQIRIESDIATGSGKSMHVVWSQDLSYSNRQVYKENGSIQTVRQSTSGRSSSLHNGVLSVLDVFSYPLKIDFRYMDPNLRNWTTHIDHSYDRVALPNPLRLSSTIHNHQITDGFYQLMTGGNFGNGSSNNTFTYVDVAGNTYTRQVNAALNAITFDREGGSLASSNTSLPSLLAWHGDSTFAGARLPGGIKA